MRLRPTLRTSEGYLIDFMLDDIAQLGPFYAAMAMSDVVYARK
jgi:hypothetical protein